MNKQELPDKPSELITVALNDLRAVEKDSRYKVQMGDWHSPEKGKCFVCLAGAVMVRSLGTPIEEFISNPEDEFDHVTGAKLMALNCVRSGDFEGAGDICPMFHDASYVPHRNVPVYHEDRKGFFRQLHRIANDYRKTGN